MIPANAVSVVYGWIDPVTKEKKPYKIVISRYYIDTDIEHPTPPSRDERFARFRAENIEGKCRFYAQDDKELDELKAKLDEARGVYTINEITLTSTQKSIIEGCEGEIPFPKVDEVRRRLGCK